MRKFLAITAAFAACALSSVTGSAPKHDVDTSLASVSLIRLLAAPERFDGKRVRVQGVFVLAHEVQILFPSADLALTNANGFWLDDDFSEQLRNFEDWKRKSGEKADAAWFEVRIEATFVSGEKGHLGMCAGSFRKITRFDWIRRIKEQDSLGVAATGER